MSTLFRHRKVLILTGIMVIISFLIAIVSILIIYSSAKKNIYARLTDIVNREKSAISVFVNNYNSTENEIINHLELVRKNDVSIGENGEITFVKLENERIRSLVTDTLKTHSFELFRNVPVTSPLYLALIGGSGYLKGKDSNGTEVFAAYTFIEKINWGIIAKIPASEINKPFIRAAILVLILSSILISICVYAFLRFTNPLIDSVIENDKKLIMTNRNLFDKIEDLRQTREKLEENEKSLLLKNEKYETLNRELKQINDQLFIAKEKAVKSENQLKELNVAKDKLFSIIAHDLRSPFNNIIGFSDLLIESAKSYSVLESKEFIAIINSCSKNAVNLLDNLLNWAKSQTGQIKFNPEKIDLSSLILEIIEISKSCAKIKNISLNRIQSDDIEVYADKNMLQTILRNLISNAIYFTDSNGKIDIYSRQINDNIEITVSDNGVGMDETKLNSLFRIDTDVTTSGMVDEKGSGLGLILCKEFVERHGGKIRVESEEGKGSDFIFTIPLSKVLTV